jgi:hypothetical protein
MGDDYRIFLTRIDPFRGRVIRGYDSGLRLVTKYSAPKTTETLSGNTLVKVTGTATTYFTLALSAMYATDPLYLVAFESRGTQEEGTDYNTGGENWEILGGGYMTYSVRCTAGTPVAVAPTKMKITGYGSWYHMTFDLANNGADYFSGTAPLNIRMGEVKYQRSEYFPEFFAAGGP